MKFMCPTCKAGRHVDDDHADPRDDRCWQCGTPVPYSADELARMDAEMAADTDYVQVGDRWQYASR
jgi:hypothetical protein